MSDVVYGNLKTPKNTKRGIGEFALVAPKSWFTEVKAPVAPFNNRGDSITIKSDHTFVVGKGFMKFGLSPDKNKLEIKTGGDKGIKTEETTVTIFIPGSYDEAHETLRNLINQPLLVIVKDANCAEGIYYNLGTDCTNAWLDYAFDTGTTADGNKGFTVTITFAEAPLFYQPTVTIPLIADTTLTAGHGATATAVLTADAVSAVNVTAGGTEYLNTPTVAFTGGGGTGAAGIAVVNNGVVTSIIVTNGGTGYTSAPTVAITAV